MIDIDGSIAELTGDIFKRAASIHKTDADLVRYQRIIDTVRPHTVIETGVYYGGSAIWFAERVPHVVVVELNKNYMGDFLDGVHGLGPAPSNVTAIEGNSLDEYTVCRVARNIRPEDGPVMVVLDSDHGVGTVYGEMCRYGPLVTPGSYMVVEDGILHYLPLGPYPVGNWYNGDPLQAIELFLGDHEDEWTVDSELEDMSPTTQHPSGFLVRR